MFGRGQRLFEIPKGQTVKARPFSRGETLIDFQFLTMLTKISLLNLHGGKGPLVVETFISVSWEEFENV